MANTRSSKKRIKINKRNQIQNNSYKSLIKSTEKRHLSLIKKSTTERLENESSYLTDLKASFALVISQIDKATKKNIIHKNTAIRKKRNLFRKTFLTNN